MGKLGLEILRLEIRIDAATFEPFLQDLIARALGVRKDGQILSGLQDVLNPPGVTRHEGHDLPSGAHVEEVVAEGKVKELPLPDLPAVVAALLIAEIVLVYRIVALDAVCYGLMPDAAVRLRLALKGKRQDPLKPAALNVHDDSLACVIRKVLFRSGYGILE